MSIRYLLDGYNIIHQMKMPGLSGLEEQRLHLIRFIECNLPQGSPKNEVTIVFDGKRDIFGGMSSQAVKVIFSKGESADEKIKKIVTEAKNTKNIIVVSDDRDVQYSVRALGAKVSGVQVFLGQSKNPKNKKRNLKRENQSPLPSGKYISKSDESKITSEMGAIWLKKRNEGQK